ncbi:tRNA (guanosine(37)-N1)-methyltransferase TrmD [Thiospirochaeta perfilievii]|uniref:tRNA (guanine-N(1)-)-methyltransferase n=1 Tax=Thiospirochaeta perfilievii TaxID=252967 RepID=A0A5C1Q9P5_9SPIO|nr:tRNA (guanosine(37)-N1)-methyltransferase TrmD [Thiospirochaeta perfilievii]QEN03830.1 tRNA (guanosine(37)-N1)-methyltransferase TrmD [Thiospirochaeta perfilievii]
MKFKILTLFPEIIEGFFSSSIMAKAVERGLIEYEILNIRDYALDKHKKCDDYPFGGGAGMVLKAEPLALALDSIKAKDKTVIFPTPSGVKYTQQLAEQFSKESEIVLVCGRYEGIDQRVIDEYVDHEVSIGDYVISSGEISSLVVIDSIYRLCDGVITKESLEEESFQGKYLEYPHYTRPAEFRGLKVPDVLLSGNHRVIEEWRCKKRYEKTLNNRPDLLKD